MKRLVAELRKQQAEGAKLDAAIEANLGGWDLRYTLCANNGETLLPG